MSIIAISAKKRHGKDTVANIISDNFDFAKYALATPFKEGMMKHFDFTYEQMNGIGFDREKDLNLDKEYIITKFICILKDLNYTPEDIAAVDWDVVRELETTSIRRLMQCIGTDIGCNQVNKFIWMYPMFDMYSELQKRGLGIIISDCRQDHEMAWMRENGAAVIHVHNPNIIDSDDHATEAGLPFHIGDHTIINDFNPNLSYNKEYCDSRLKILTRHVIKTVNIILEKNV